MSRNLTVIATVFAVCLALVLLGGLVWANTAYVRDQPVAKDFVVPWLAARTFIQYGDSPYGEPAAQRAQIVYYGKLADAGQDPLSLWLTGWQPARTLLPFVLLFPVLWIYGAFSLNTGSGIGLIVLALAGLLLALREERDELAGGLLLLILFAPRITGIFIFFIAWWIIYQRRWRILWGFLMSLVLLLALSFLFLPDWVVPFLGGLLTHLVNNPGLSVTSILASWSPIVGPRIGWVISGGLLLVLFVEWGNTLRKDPRHFLWTVSLTLVATPLLGIPMLPREYGFLFIPLVLFLSILDERWSSRSTFGARDERRPRRWGVAGITLILILAGSWLLALQLSAANADAALADTLFLLLPLSLFIGLYWMRWWYVRPRHDEILSLS